MLKSAESVGADEIVFDLEDSVAWGEKDRARDLLVEALNSQQYEHEWLSVRINPVTSPLAVHDLSTLVRHCAGRFDSIVIPKVESTADVEFALRLIALLEADEEAAEPASVQILVESSRGLIHLREVVSTAGDRLAALVFGPGDYAGDLGLFHDAVGAAEPDYPGHQWNYVMGAVVANARAGGALAIDGPFGKYDDPDGFAASARIGRAMGFAGKWCIHPSQVDAANDIFSPTSEEYERACAILEALGPIATQNDGAVSFRGRMIDEAHRPMAERVVRAYRPGNAPHGRTSRMTSNPFSTFLDSDHAGGVE